MIRTGEFIRSSLNKKPVLSGIWLAGLLLKPQLLILIVPIILLMRYSEGPVGICRFVYGNIADLVVVVGFCRHERVHHSFDPLGRRQLRHGPRDDDQLAHGWG